MNKKINTICFIFLFLFLISAVSAANNESEAIESISQPEPCDELCQVNVENDEQLEATDNDLLSKEEYIVLHSDKEKVSISAPDVIMHYKDGSKFKVTLKDFSKKAMKNVKVKIEINGATYTRTTDSKGTATLNLNFKSGTYTVLTTFAETSKYAKASKKSTVTIKSTIKCSNLEKYYKNTASYFATFYDKKGKLLKNTAVKFKLNGKTYSVKTSSKGIGKLKIDLKPGKYSISCINSKTSESVAKTITIHSWIQTSDLTVEEYHTGKFNVKLFNSNGKAAKNKKVTIKLDGKTYTRTTDSNGIATLDINLNAGKYTVITEYNGLKETNKITVNRISKISNFLHSILIPNYVNLSLNYVYENSIYCLRSGPNGIVKMPKNEIFTVQIGDRTYQFSDIRMDGVDSVAIGHKYHLVPFDGSEIVSDYNRSNLNTSGIVISRTNDYTQFDYQSNTTGNIELFGFYADKGALNSETITYMQNDKITARINILTQSFDELGLKDNLAKYYQKSIYDFDYKSYDEITRHNTGSIKFANTNIPVTFSYFGRSVEGYNTKEDIITKFAVDGKEELEKQETISYGFGDKYRKTLGFEVLQAYSIINEKITPKTLENWANKNGLYLNRFGVMNVYAMHMASLETAWLADKLADEYSEKFDVTWKRSNTATILGGINMEDTYLNILNADMGMEVKGSEKNSVFFRLMNSLQLPNLEEYSLEEVSKRYWNITTNSQDNMFMAISSNKFSISQLGDMLYVFSHDGSDSAIILNTTDGVSNVIHSQNHATYKGSSISTAGDCCSVCMLAQDILGGIENALKLFSPADSMISDFLDNIHPLSVLGYHGIKLILQYGFEGASSACMGLVSAMALIQTVGTTYRDKVDEKDWYGLMDSIAFTRPGYLQGKQVFNIPNENGGYDYIEVNINNDLSLDRNNALYISDEGTRKLTVAETYQYFTEESWTGISVPSKYWDPSWRR